MSFHDFDEYERLVAARARSMRPRTSIVLLGGEAGLRCGEMIALEWGDVDLGKRQTLRPAVGLERPGGDAEGRTAAVCAAHAIRLAAAFARASASAEPDACCARTTASRSRGRSCSTGCCCAARRAKLSQEGVHILRHTFCSHLAMRGAPARAIQELAGHRGSDDDAALHAPEPGGARQRRFGCWIGRLADTKFWRHFGDGEGLRRKTINGYEQLNWR